MIIRIVKMEFRPESLAQFHQLFDRQKHRIRTFPGCRHLELHIDPQNACVRYTYSTWDSVQALESYRSSELFLGTWAQTKALFASAPTAFSLEKMEEVQDFQDF
jgi:quinol monooxygenase YgiN